uniref:Cystatin domain-containing protein n=1 Tax=Xenopus tropicalis TaxID=8364 RepID=B2RYZ3_XENTR|nr:Unknown (protein for MGC:189005) [Xenopus tropicalis]
MMCGGTGASQPADAVVQEICQKIRDQFIEKSGLNTDIFVPISYKTQQVAGTNFFIKAHIGDNKCVHLRVYRMLPHQQEALRLDKFLLDKTMEEEVVYF